jgi:GrpB-like predicted nucleotidyltransferase (UPF0157 family)
MALAKIVPYSRAWPEEFRRTAAELRCAVGPQALRIDHIGSTAVAGLPVKDVIDIQVAVAALDPAIVAGLELETGVYADVKDPVCDLIMVAAEEWASRTAWRPGPSDA